MKEYIEVAAPLMKRIDAEVVVRGRYIKTLIGDAEVEHIVGVFRFKDMDTAERFYSCEEYSNIVHLRDDAGAMTFKFYQE